MARSRRGSGSVYRRGATWWVKYFQNGSPFYESSHSKIREDADRLLKRRQAEIATGKFAGLGPERIRIRELLDDVIADYELHRQATLDDVKSRVERHLGPAFGHLRAADLRTQDIQKYISARRAQAAADATVNRELAVLRRAFNLGLKSDPPKVTRLLRVPRLREQNARTGFLEYPEYLKLRDELPEHVRLIFVITYHTGVRVGELRQIRWEQVDLAAREIRLESSQTKNGEPRTIPVYGEMVQWLEWAKEERDQKWPGCPWVFHKHGRELRDFRKVWASACKRAGVPSLLFHDLRRSAVRIMERAAVPRKVAMAISGHKTEAVYRRYDIVSHRDLGLAATKLQDYLETQAAQKPANPAAGKPTTEGRPS